MLFMASGLHAADHLDRPRDHGPRELHPGRLLQTRAAVERGGPQVLDLGALSSGILLYGISLLYGATGTIQLAELSEDPCGTSAGNPLVPLGWLMLAAGLFFKIAAVPFHIWTPDVYVGAPTPVTAWLAVASKAASFAHPPPHLLRGAGGP